MPVCIKLFLVVLLSYLHLEAITSKRRGGMEYETGFYFPFSLQLLFKSHKEDNEGGFDRRHKMVYFVLLIYYLASPLHPIDRNKIGTAIIENSMKILQKIKKLSSYMILKFPARFSLSLRCTDCVVDISTRMVSESLDFD